MNRKHSGHFSAPVLVHAVVSFDGDLPDFRRNLNAAQGSAKGLFGDVRVMQGASAQFISVRAQHPPVVGIVFHPVSAWRTVTLKVQVRPASHSMATLVTFASPATAAAPMPSSKQKP